LRHTRSKGEKKIIKALRAVNLPCNALLNLSSDPAP